MGDSLGEKAYIDLAKKADKTQDDWLAISLLIGSTGTLNILKDSMGFVHLEGEVTKDPWANNDLFAVIPAGYLPESNKHFLCPGNYASSSVRSILIKAATGEMYNFGTTGVKAYINIVYKCV